MSWPGCITTPAGGVVVAASSSSWCSSRGSSLGSGVAWLGLGGLLLCASTSSCAGVDCGVLYALLGGALKGGALKGTACSAVLGVADLAGGGDAGGCFAITWCSLSLLVLGTWVSSPKGGAS